MSKTLIEAIYTLSPLQEGLVFHSVYEPGSGAYVIQSDCVINGPLDVASFRRAWEEVVSRHSALRTAFVWGNRDRPVQVVLRGVEIDWQEHDWSDECRDDLQARRQCLLRQDRDRGFKLSKAPLMRFSLVRIEEMVFYFTWSFHHLLLDAWARVQVIKEVFRYYQSYERAEELALPEPHQYKEYIEWLERQDRENAETFWRAAIDGLAGPTELHIESPVGQQPEPGYDEQDIYLTEEAGEQLKQLAQQRRVTVNTAAQGAWAILLAHYSGCSDVVFGTTVSGRPADLEGVEEMVGLFINTIPARVKIKPQQPVDEWLKQIQQQQLEARQYEYLSLAEIQKWAGTGAGKPLLTSNMTFQNFPYDVPLRDSSAGIEVSQVRSIERGDFPIGVVVEPGRRLRLCLSYDRLRFDSQAIKRILFLFSCALESIASNPDVRLASLIMWLRDAETRRRVDEESDLSQARLKAIKQTRRRVAGHTSLARANS